jgi:hypothetical protein
MAKKRTVEDKIAAIDSNPRLNRKMERGYDKVAKKTEQAQGKPTKLAKIEKKFGYNYAGADKAGIKPDSTGHMSSLGNKGLVLKGTKHPSMPKTVKIERILGNKIVKVKGDRYSVPKKEVKVAKKEIKQSLITSKFTKTKR